MFQEMKRVGFDSSIKALTFEFRNMLEVEQVFDMTCLVTDIRNRTFDVEITGRSTTETPHDIFVARLTPIMVSRTERRSIEIPPNSGSGWRAIGRNLKARWLRQRSAPESAIPLRVVASAS